MSDKPTYAELEQKCKRLESKAEERQKLQTLLHQAQKKEAVETLAGGIAHKFNNALSGIIGNIELLRLKLPDNRKVIEYTDRMITSAQKMTHLSNQLLAYAEGGRYKVESLSLRGFIENALSSIRHKFPPAIQVKTEISSDIKKIKGDPVQIQILLSAIIENAAEAIENNGCIRITAQNKDIDELYAKKHKGLKPGSYLHLKIIDDGIGMDNETKCRIFDPFFTTNFQGRGLGMAAVWGIIRSHKGWIDVESEPGKGTQTSIFLPAITAQMEKPWISDAKTSTNTGTILLIEDEKIVQDVEQAMMKRLGYKVLAAESGEEALSILKAFDGKIDLVLLDLCLPSMGGRELYPLLMDVRPDLKVVVCSGYSIDGIAQDVLDAGAQDFIQKPFRFSELASLLKKNIDRRKFKRFPIEKATVASPRPAFLQQGKLIEISRGGLSFCYRDDAGGWDDHTEQSINVLLESIRLYDIHYRTISDSPLAGSSSLKPEWIRRRGVQFTDLTSHNTTRLNSIIQSQMAPPI